ncbi:MAG: ATP-binding cassette domain-containing protein [Nitriliruptoraceae bacterium]
MATSERPARGLEVVGLTRRFGRVAALEDVSLRVRPGELVAVVGENGAGKTTLVRCIAGELPPDRGTITFDAVPLPARQPAGRRRGRRPRSGPRPVRTAVVWQDLGLCDDLDVVANIFLGQELGRGLLAEARMQEAATAALQRLGARLPDLHTEVAGLSRGQQQQVALARALLREPELLVLDEPTAALAVGRRAEVAASLRRSRGAGRAILLVTHDLDEAFALADRIVVLRRGRVAAVISPSEVHPDDVQALMSGVETESVARRQLDRLRSLVEQLSAAGPTVSLPLVVSATALALDQEQLCIHLLTTRDGVPMLARGAAVGLPTELLTALETLHLDARGATIGEAARRGELVVCEDLTRDPSWRPHRDAIAAAGIRAVWAAPIVGSSGVLGTITGFSSTAGRLNGDQLELLSLYLGHTAAAIEREQLFEEATRRNRVLESLRGILEPLAGPGRADGGVTVALLALCHGLGAGAAGLLVVRADGAPRWSTAALDGTGTGALEELASRPVPTTPGQVAAGVVGVQLPLADGRATLVVRHPEPDRLVGDGHQLMEDAVRSLALAIEREQLDRVQQEAEAARRSQALQRDLLQRLSHELRTPLTAIHGYASTLRQPDLTWDERSTHRFLAAIAKESARMERLVTDLLDSSAIETGLLQLRPDWTDLGLVVEAARACVRHPERIDLNIAADLEPVWADHDRLEQVFVNLMDNAVRHGGEHVEVQATTRDNGTVVITVTDDGPGVPTELVPTVFDARVHTATSNGAGLGLAIARGIAEAHGGSCRLLDGHHTVFEVVLPIEPADPPRDTTPEVVASSRAGLSSSGAGGAGDA